MVKKLFKYEFLAFLRVMLPVEIAVLGVGIVTRLIQLFDNDTLSYHIAFISSCVLLGIAVVVSSVMVFIVTLRRFYKNLFTSEGYLSFTLPVTPAQHILVKGVTAAAFDVIGLIVAILSCMIACDFEFLIEIFKAFNYCVAQAFKMLPNTHLIFWIFEIFVFALVYVATNILLYYACISIGQTAKKNRVGAAVGVYFIYYAITQVLGTVFIIVSAVITETEWFIKLLNWIPKHYIATMHIGFIGAIVICGAIGTLFFFISHNIMRKKLNLE